MLSVDHHEVALALVLGKILLPLQELLGLAALLAAAGLDPSVPSRGRPLGLRLLSIGRGCLLATALGRRRAEPVANSLTEGLVANSRRHRVEHVVDVNAGHLG